MTPPERPSPDVLTRIADAIRGVRFGMVQVVIHDARVVQIERIERIRMVQEADPTAGGSATDLSRADRTPGGPRTNPAVQG